MLRTVLTLALVPAPQLPVRSTPPLPDVDALAARPHDGDDARSASPADPSADLTQEGAAGPAVAGGGLHLGDFDGDGLPDVWAQPARGAGRLYWNRGEGRFLEVSEALGLVDADGARAVRWVDGDGAQDLVLLSGDGHLTLWSLDGAGLFVERAAERGLPARTTATELRLADLDGDGAPDLLLTDARATSVWLQRDGGWVDLGAALPGAAGPERRAAGPLAAASGATGTGAAGTGTEAAPLAPSVPPAGAIPRCTPSLEDQANVLTCLLASSVPTLGLLYPISPEWFVDASTGFVGIGTVTPSVRLDVEGTVRSGSGGFEFPDGSVQTTAQLVGPQGPAGDPGIVGGAAEQTARHDGVGWVGSDLLRNTGTQVQVGPSPVTGSLVAVRADPSGFDTAITGEANGSGPGGAGVRGVGVADDGVGVEGFALSFTGDGVGVRGDAFAGTGVTGVGMLGVVGEASALVPDPGQTVVGVIGTSDYDEGVGVRGEVTGPSAIAVHALGDLVVTGAKAFAQPHPTDPRLELRFACLEGPESGTYCRGSDELLGGVARVSLPEVFGLASSTEGLTAQVTPRGPGRLWVESVDREALVVRGDVDVPFDWFVHGVRRGFEDFEVVRPNVSFPATTPEGAGQYPAGLRAILRGAGLLDAEVDPGAGAAAEREARRQALRARRTAGAPTEAPSGPESR